MNCPKFMKRLVKWELLPLSRSPCKMLLTFLALGKLACKGNHMWQLCRNSAYLGQSLAIFEICGGKPAHGPSSGSGAEFQPGIASSVGSVIGRWRFGALELDFGQAGQTRRAIVLFSSILQRFLHFSVLQLGLIGHHVAFYASKLTAEGQDEVWWQPCLPQSSLSILTI